MSPTKLRAGEMDRHLRLMRLTTGIFLATVALAVVAVVVLPRRDSMASPWAMTLIALIAALWVGFTANRDAQTRLDRIKRAYAVHGDDGRLLADLRRVHLAVLVRLEAMVLAGVVAAVWGQGRAPAWGILALAAVMMALAWPTADKSHALLERARELRGR
jgi:hypothetical protein